MNPFNTFHVYGIVTALLPLIIIPLTSCIEIDLFRPMPWGTAEQAMQARSLLQADEQYINQTMEEFSTELSRISIHAGVQLFVNQMFLSGTPVFPLQPIHEAQLLPFFGDFNETSPGIFELVQQYNGPLLTVSYLDGTTVTINIDLVGEQNKILGNFEFSFGSSTVRGGGLSIEAVLRQDWYSQLTYPADLDTTVLMHHLHLLAYIMRLGLDWIDA